EGCISDLGTHLLPKGEGCISDLGTHLLPKGEGCISDLGTHPLPKGEGCISDLGTPGASCIIQSVSPTRTKIATNSFIHLAPPQPSPARSPHCRRRLYPTPV